MSEILTIPQKNMVDFLENIIVEVNAEEKIILIEDEDEASLNLNRLQFSFDPISKSKWSMIIHNTKTA